MELRVAGHEVLLTLHRSYCAEDESSVLQSVSKFKPLVDYLTKLSTEGFHLSTLTVRNVNYIAQRIISITVDALFSSQKSRDVVSETITLSDDVLAAFLPVVKCNDVSYGVLVEQKRVACGGSKVAEAFTGVQAKPGGFTGAHTGLLTDLELPLDGGLSLLSSTDIVIGNEGIAPVRFLTATKVVTVAELEKLRNFTSDVASLVVLPLDEILGSTVDAKAAVAAALALQQ